MVARRTGISRGVVRRFALTLPEAVERSHFDQPDFRVRNKIFATLPHDRLLVCLRTTPVNLAVLVQADPDTFRDAWRSRWVAVRLDRVRQSVLRDLLEDAWRLVAPKRLVAARTSAPR